MSRYEFTEQGERDLENIIDYTVTKWGRPQADKYIDGLEQLTQKLADQPDIGTGRSDLYAGLLSFPYTSHVLYFVKQPHGITVIRVLHKHMMPGRHIDAKSDLKAK